MVGISLFSPLQGDYASRSAELARQQKLAQMLEQMSQQEIPVSTAGGITAPVSPYSALAKALTSFGGAYLSGKSAADEAEMKRAARAEALAARNALYETPPETKTMAGGTYTLKGPESDYTPNVNSEFPEPIARQAPPIPKLEIGDINYNLPAMPRSYEDQRRMLDEYELSDNPLIAQMAASQRSRIEADRDRAAPKFAAAGTGGQVDTNPNSPTFGKKIGAPEPKPIEKHGEYYQQLVDAGLTPGTPEFNAEMKRKLRKETYIAPVTGPSPGAPQSYIIDGKQVFTTPQDALSRAQKGSTVAVASTSATATEGERKAATLYGRLKFSLDQLKNATTESPNAASPSALASIAGSINPVLGNLATPEDRQRVETAQLDILDAALTLGTGAAYTKDQLEGYRKSYFPQYGDKPQTIIDKQNRLANIIKQAEVAAGRAANLAVSQTEPTVDPERAELNRLRAEKAARDAQKPGAR